MIPAHAWSRHSALKGAAAVGIQPVGIRPEEAVGIPPGRHSGCLPKLLCKTYVCVYVCVFTHISGKYSLTPEMFSRL